MRQIILDTETTGLSPREGHRIIEIGCVEMINRKFTGNNFHYYINPQREIDAGAMRVHGITNTFLADKPLFKEVYSEFIDYINGGEAVIHNAPFDVGFLNHEFQRLKKTNPLFESYCGIVDTLVMARKKHPGQRNSLDALCKRYFIDNSDRELHGALLDAKILGQVYLAMTGGQRSLFDSNGTFDSLQSESLEKKGTDARGVQLNANQINNSKKIWELPVINANEDELKKHQAYLDRIKQDD